MRDNSLLPACKSDSPTTLHTIISKTSKWIDKSNKAFLKSFLYLVFVPIPSTENNQYISRLFWYKAKYKKGFIHLPLWSSFFDFLAITIMFKLLLLFFVIINLGLPQSMYWGVYEIKQIFQSLENPIALHILSLWNLLYLNGFY